MKVYTQQDFDALTRDNDGYIHCPSGDWTQVDFGRTDKIRFDFGCRLGDGCELGNECKLGDWCTLGDRCRLGDRCTIGDCCELGDWCTLEGGRVRNAAYFFAGPIGSEGRTAYAYCDRNTGAISIRACCWFGDIDAFEQRVRKVHRGTAHETDYLSFAAFARARFARYTPTHILEFKEEPDV